MQQVRVRVPTLNVGSLGNKEPQNCISIFTIWPFIIYAHIRACSSESWMKEIEVVWRESSNNTQRNIYARRWFLASELYIWCAFSNEKTVAKPHSVFLWKVRLRFPVWVAGRSYHLNPALYQSRRPQGRWAGPCRPYHDESHVRSLKRWIRHFQSLHRTTSTSFPTFPTYTSALLLLSSGFK